MAEEKFVKLNIRKRMKKIPKWKRKSEFVKQLKRALGKGEISIDQKLNEKIWSAYNPKLRVKVVKDGKSTKAEFVE